MIKINFSLLKILTMNSLNAKHQGKSSNQLAFHLSVYTHLWKLSRAIFQKYKKYKLTVWIIQSLILMIKMTCKRKVRLHEAMQEKSKTASYSEPIQILNLMPDKWSRLYCSEYFNILEYLASTSHEIKKVGEWLAKPAPEERKSYHHWNISSSNKRFWRWQFK